MPYTLPTRYKLFMVAPLRVIYGPGHWWHPSRITPATSKPTAEIIASTSSNVTTRFSTQKRNSFLFQAISGVVRYWWASGRTVTLEVALPEHSCYTTLHRFYITPISVWAFDLASLALSRSVYPYGRVPCFQSSFQGGLRLWLRRPEKVGLKASRTRSVC